jgi:hypothetical protein
MILSSIVATARSFLACESGPDFGVRCLYRLFGLVSSSALHSFAPKSLTPAFCFTRGNVSYVRVSLD